MTIIDQESLNTAADWESKLITILQPGPQTRTLIPETWWPIAESDDAEERKQSALGLWNADFLDLVPRYADMLHNALVDVRVAKHSEIASATLDYVVRRWDGSLHVWVGEDPRTFGQEPLFFDSIPEAVRTFLRQVHAGYTTYDGLSCGVNPPTQMKTLAAYWGTPDQNEFLEWEEEEYEFPGTQRLLVVTSNETSHLFTSPDLPADDAVTYFEPDYEVEPFGAALDTFLNMPLGG